MNAIDVLNALQPFLNWLQGQSRVRQPVALEAPGLEAGTYFVDADGELLVHGSELVRTVAYLEIAPKIELVTFDGQFFHTSANEQVVVGA